MEFTHLRTERWLAIADGVMFLIKHNVGAKGYLVEVSRTTTGGLLQTCRADTLTQAKQDCANYLRALRASKEREPDNYTLERERDTPRIH